MTDRSPDLEDLGGRALMGAGVGGPIDLALVTIFRVEHGGS
jgi:hypothetical protein